MFFVCAKYDNDMFGVIDTVDGKIEQYSASQLIESVKLGITIHGIEIRSIGTVINVVTPKSFSIVQESFYSNLDVIDRKKAGGALAKTKLLGVEPFYRVFSPLYKEHCIGNIEELILNFHSYNEKQQIMTFGFACDYSCNYFEVKMSDLNRLLKNSPYNSKVTMRTGSVDKIPLCIDGICYIAFPLVYRDYLVKSLMNFLNYFLSSRTNKNFRLGSMQFEDLIIQKRRQDTNIGKASVIDILYNFEGLLICLDYGMKESYLGVTDASDSLYKLISRLSNED